MNYQHKSQPYLRAMVSKWTILFAFITLILFSNFECGSREYSNELYIVNGTGDTLVFCISIVSPYDSTITLRDKMELYPYENFPLGGKENASVADLIKCWSWWDTDTVKIFKLVCDTCGGTPFSSRGGNRELFLGNTCYAKWGGPVVSLPNDVYSFYNTNSWVIKEGGVNNKYFFATFTIREEDLEQDEQKNM